MRRFAHSAELAISVLRDYWGIGLGRHLMQTLCQWADEHELWRVYLEVAATNARALYLYRALGFEVEGRLRARRKHRDTFVDGLVMAKLHSNVRQASEE